MEMHWSFECSNVLAPIVKAVAPHDHYRIWKKGSWLRMDSTITGILYTHGIAPPTVTKRLQGGCGMLQPWHIRCSFLLSRVRDRRASSNSSSSSYSSDNPANSMSNSALLAVSILRSPSSLLPCSLFLVPCSLLLVRSCPVLSP